MSLDEHVTYQHGESIAVVYGAGQDHRGVAKVSLEVAVCVAVRQQELQRGGRDKDLTVMLLFLRSSPCSLPSITVQLRQFMDASQTSRGRCDKVFSCGRKSQVLSSSEL